MPELPEVETVRRSLEPHLVGHTIERVVVRDGRLRQPVAARALQRLATGRRIEGLRRRAKYLLVDLQGDVVLLLHLGMSGRLAVVPAERALQKHDHVCFGVSGGRELRFNDARRFGLVEAFERADEARHPRLRHLGMEPLGEEFDAAALQRACAAKKKPIKNHLMDGQVLVGVGNIYACESLWRAAIDPRQPAGRLSAAQVKRLHKAVVATLGHAIKQGGTTLRDFRDADGNAGYFAIDLRVYDRAGEACYRCGAKIRRIVQAGRATFFCPGCQKRR